MYNLKFWRQKYELLFKRKTNGQMSWNITQKVIDFQNELKPYLKEKFNTVIDFGCGTGKNVKFLIDIFKAKKYIGYDIVDLVIKENKKQYPFMDFRLYEEEIEKTDVIYSSFVLQHINEDNFIEILKVFKKALKKNGKIYIVNAIIDGTNTNTMFYRGIPEHLLLFKKADLKGDIIYEINVNGTLCGLFEVTK